MTEPDAGNAPEAFDGLTPLKQAQLRAWIRANLEATRRVGDGQYSHSYGLKHLAEKSLGWYVSNGELKGAMLAEGYRWEPCDGTPKDPNPNWVFNSQQRKADARGLGEGERRGREARTMNGLSHFLVDAEMEAVQSRDDNGPMHSLHEAYAVLLEEVDELWQHVKTNPKRRDAQAIYRELVQIAAVAACTAVELLSNANEAQ
jgi:hypothetical protein